MPSKQLTTTSTESDLEAAIHGAIALAFPWLPSGAVRHQTSFSFTFGGRRIMVGDQEREWVKGRSDVILYSGNDPLAVLELKREGIELTEDDDAQGLSYARLLTAMPPLVVVTNGKDIRFIETYTGKPWLPTQASEQAFHQLIASASKLAAADLKNAVETLMGLVPTVWMQAIRAVSDQTLEEICTAEEHLQSPFARDFLIPRDVTESLEKALLAGEKLVLVDGHPLCGKSNVLRELCVRTSESENLAALYVEASSGSGILQAVADALSRELHWDLTVHEVRAWLRRLSQSAEPERRLVLVIDGLDPSDTSSREMIEVLTSTAFGAGLGIVASLDDTAADALTQKLNARANSTIGRRAVRMRVEALSNVEFTRAVELLSSRRIQIMKGAEYSLELREPWILRSLVSTAQEQLGEAPEGAFAGIPPLLSLDLIRRARTRFSDPELRRIFRAVARAVQAEASDRKRPKPLILRSLQAYSIRRAVLLSHIDVHDLRWLSEHGLAKQSISDASDAVISIRLPELLASELAIVLAEQLTETAQQDAGKAAAWLASMANCLHLGDVVAAQAVLDAVGTNGKLPYDVIDSLLSTPPTRGAPAVGRSVLTLDPDGVLIEMTVLEGGRMLVVKEGKQRVIQLEDDASGLEYEHLEQWLILSHLAGVPFIAENEDAAGRLDHELALVVGSADVVLRRPGGSPDVVAVPTHDVPSVGSMVCSAAGIVEAITFSIFQLFMRQEPTVDQWIDEAIARQSTSLLCRVDIALRQVAQSADQSLKHWAEQTRVNRIAPALANFPGLHH
ncbi:hypothetical protein ACNI65_21955 [Roseateles sp. So40a]|uniref:hypothetical protein n=1 Tax=Roseateles sp. So40a TaxID=3400226 RepID=UPI003A84020B